jgi:hypothetical protein
MSSAMLTSPPQEITSSAIDSDDNGRILRSEIASQTPFGYTSSKATRENLAEAKKIFGLRLRHVPRCSGRRQGDLAASQRWRGNDWRQSSKLESMPDKEIFDLIVKGKGKMVGEADRYSPEKAWERLTMFVPSRRR